MSRIIKSIIDSVLKTENKNYVIFHSNTAKDMDIVKIINGKPISFEKNQLDIDNVCKIINDQTISTDLSLSPKFVVCTSFQKYHNAKNLSELFKIPLINIIYGDISNIKKESIFGIAKNLDKDFNIFFDENIPKSLFITNYKICSVEQIKSLIDESCDKWKP